MLFPGGQLDSSVAIYWPLATTRLVKCCWVSARKSLLLHLPDAQLSLFCAAVTRYCWPRRFDCRARRGHGDPAHIVRTAGVSSLLEGIQAEMLGPFMEWLARKNPTSSGENEVGPRSPAVAGNSFMNRARFSSTKKPFAMMGYGEGLWSSPADGRD